MFNVYPRKLNTCEASGFIFSWYYSIQRLKMFSVSCCKSLHSQMVGCDPRNALDLFWSREKAKCKQFSELGMSKIMVMVFILLIIKQSFLEILLLNFLLLWQDHNWIFKVEQLPAKLSACSIVQLRSKVYTPFQNLQNIYYFTKIRWIINNACYCLLTWIRFHIQYVSIIVHKIK